MLPLGVLVFYILVFVLVAYWLIYEGVLLVGVMTICFWMVLIVGLAIVSALYSSGHQVVTTQKINYVPAHYQDFMFVADVKDYTELTIFCNPVDNYWLFNLKGCDQTVTVHTTKPWAYAEGEHVLLWDLK